MTDVDRPTQPLDPKLVLPARATKSFEERLREINNRQDETVARAQAVVNRGEEALGRLKGMDPKKTKFCVEAYHESVVDSDSKQIIVRVTTTEEQADPPPDAPHKNGAVVTTTSYKKVTIRKDHVEDDRKAAV